MSKRITDFFNLGSNKRQKTSVNDQDGSEHTDQNKYPLDEAVTSSSQSSQDIAYIEQSSGRKDSTSSITVEALQPSTSFSNPNSDSTSDTIKTTNTLYKGAKLDSSWLIKTYPCLKNVKVGKRSGIKCTICFKQIQEAKKF